MSKVPHKYGLTFSEDEFIRDLTVFLQAKGISHLDATAVMIKEIITTKSPLGRLLNFGIDVCADHLISDEFYKSYPALMLFICRSGATYEELCFRAYHYTHSELFTCKKCKNPLVGGCPIVECTECGKKYYMDIEGISSDMCKNCVSYKLGTCSEDDRTRIYKICGM